MGLSVIKKTSLKIVIFSLSWIGALVIVYFAETPYKKIGALSRSMKFLSSEVARNNAVMPGLALPIGIWIFWISYRNSYDILLALHLLLYLNPWLILDIRPA